MEDFGIIFKRINSTDSDTCTNNISFDNVIKDNHTLPTVQASNEGYNYEYTILDRYKEIMNM